MQLQFVCRHDFSQCPKYVKLGFNVFVHERKTAEMLTDWLNTMLLSDGNFPAVPEWTKHSGKKFIIVYVWLNIGSTTPAAHALVHRISNRGWQTHRVQWLVGCCFVNRKLNCLPSVISKKCDPYLCRGGLVLSTSYSSTLLSLYTDSLEHFPLFDRTEMIEINLKIVL